MDISQAVKESMENISVGLDLILREQKNLRNTLMRKGVSIAKNDKLSDLVDKVILIKNNPYFAKGTTFKVSSSQTFVLENLNRKPMEFGFLSESLMDSKVYGSTDGYVVPSLAVKFPADSDTITIANGCVVSRVYDESRNMWSVKCSYEAKSQTTYFQGGYQYTWVVIYEV